jgi:hypothetical protein
MFLHIVNHITRLLLVSFKPHPFTSDSSQKCSSNNFNCGGSSGFLCLWCWFVVVVVVLVVVVVEVVVVVVVILAYCIIYTI